MSHASGNRLEDDTALLLQIVFPWQSAQTPSTSEPGGAEPTSGLWAFSVQSCLLVRTVHMQKAILAFEVFVNCNMT